MRGESKYHYVDLALIEDHQEIVDPDRVQRSVDVGSTTAGRLLIQRLVTTGASFPHNVFTLRFTKGLMSPTNAHIHRQQSQIPADTTVFPSPDLLFSSNPFSSNLNKNMAHGSLYLDCASHNILQGPSSSNMVQRELKFPAGDELSYHEDDPIDLPSITKYLPVGTDIDSANALTALYRSHCISVIDCFRFCKEKMLWYHFTSFHGTLTVPSQKLLANPSIAPWIKECDWLMYQRMIRFVAPLALQVVPVRVIDTFRAISNKLGPHISNTFQNLPQHVQDAKLGPAITFAGLLDRLLRVNASAHAAANMLTNDANRDQMWQDWVLYVNPIRVVESSLPGCGYTRVLQVLTREICDLLGPLRTTAYMGMNPIFATAERHAASHISHHAHPEIDDSSTEGVLDRWTNFLQTLPSRFPGADPRLLLHCVSEVGSAALRDITMAQALSFGSWWVTKVWVDEMLQWLAEKGGFMEGSPKSMQMRGKTEFSPDEDFLMDDGSEMVGGSRPRTAISESVDNPSRYGSVDVVNNYHRDRSRAASVPQPPFKHPEIPLPNNLEGQQSRRPSVSNQSMQPIIPQSSGLHSQHNVGLGISHPQLQHEELRQASNTNGQSHDDSGISMGLDDDDLSMAKFGGFVAGGVGGGSDPSADVEVC